MKTLSLKKESRRKELVIDLFKKIEFLSTKPPADPLEEHEQIEESLSKIIELEKDIAVQLPRREDKWSDFVQWCTQQGVAMDKFAVRKVAEGEFGLFANCDFDQNEVLMRIPRHMFLTNEAAFANPKLATLAQDVLFAHMPNLILAFHLMAEYNNPKSFWAPYLRTLPSSYSTVLYLSHEELLQLRGSPLLEEVVKIKRNVARQYAYLSMKLEVSSRTKSGNPFGPFTYELFRWALSTVMTRQNSVPCKSDSDKGTLALIPLWDLCNHKQGNLCTDFDPKEHNLVFYSMSDLKAGDEIFNHYGNRKNSDFFLHNGFVYEDHPEDAVRLKIGLSAADPLFVLKETLCKKINLPAFATFELAHKSAPLNPQLLALVRIFLLDKDQLDKWINSEQASRLFESACPELAHLNDKVAQFISMRCSLLLRKYPPIDKYLSDNIAKIVSSEKRILQSYVA